MTGFITRILMLNGDDRSLVVALFGIPGSRVLQSRFDPVQAE